MFSKINKAVLRNLYSFSCSKFKGIHSSVLKHAELKSSLQSIQFDDIRLQNYLKSLKSQYITVIDNAAFVQNYEYLKTVFTLIEDINRLDNESTELVSFISDLKGKDEEMVKLAEKEMVVLQEKLSYMKLKVLHHLIPEETIDDKDIIMELSAGVGGQEAMLFTKTMFDMYCNFVQWKGWNLEVLKHDETDIGGLRCGHIAVSGQNAYKILKYECGVHRVQRIPKTEKAGRIHTSTMTVAVLPQPSEIDIIIKPSDIEMEFKRSGGAGGQHVNTTDSCVRITHKATGIVCESQMERNQHKNRELAMKSLRAKLYERELESIMKETTSSRKLQIGTAGRSEKVRTYNFVQDRITDHRAHISLHNIQSYFSGDELLNEMLDNLEDWNSARILMDIIQKYKT